MQWEYAGGCHFNLSLFNQTFLWVIRVQSLHFPAPGRSVWVFQPNLHRFCVCAWEVKSKAGASEILGWAFSSSTGLSALRVWPWGSLLVVAQARSTVATSQEVEMLVLCRSPWCWRDAGLWHW